MRRGLRLAGLVLVLALGLAGSGSPDIRFTPNATCVASLNGVVYAVEASF